MQRSTYVIGLLIIGFLGFKVVRFQLLGYTFNDMYAFIQMSHSWLDGRPFMYENIWGYHHQIHNYYTVLLWGPLTHWLGAYGLFIAQSLLLLLAYGLINEQLCRRRLLPWARYTVLAVVLLGPVSFWLNDHPNIGWHTELSYLPLALLFASALLSEHLLPVLVAGFAVVLVKEDGAVLAALIHLAYEWLRTAKTAPRLSLIHWLRKSRFWLIVAGWVVIFVIGLFWLRLKNQAPEPRLQAALTLLSDKIGTAGFWWQMLGLVSKSLVLSMPALAVLIVLVGGIRRDGMRQALLVWILGVLILTALNFVQSVHYYGQPLFYLVSLTWPPRFVLVWAFSAAFLVLLTGVFARQVQPRRPMGILVTSVVLFGLQIPILYLVRPDFPSLRDWLRVARGQYDKQKNLAYLQPADMSVARCIADKLPATANVFAYDFLVPVFHRQYEIWPTGKHFQPADVAIIPREMTALRSKIPMRKPYQIIRLKAYDLYVTNQTKPLVLNCIQ